MTNRTDRLASRIAQWANASFAIALSTTIVIVGWPRVQHALGMTASSKPAAYRTGQTIDVPVAWYDSAPQTLLIFARASCSGCQAAQPFLQQLVNITRAHGDAVVASPGLDPIGERTYADSLAGVDAGHSYVSPGGLRLKVTPTLVLVNRRGEILGAWEGVGPPEKQKVILDAVTAAFGS